MDEKYNIDTLTDGTKVALVDSVGSQANRMEPLFLEEEFRELVPQITIRYGAESHQAISILEAGHRLGDAVIRCTALASEAHEAFVHLGRGDAAPIARLAPTSLVFGAWDSRDTGIKVPRLVQAVIRAWEVAKLSRSAQFNPALDYASIGVVYETKVKAAEKKVWAERGYLHVPSTGDHGGVIARGPIVRDVTINLVALRRLNATDNGEALRRYLLGLALIAGGEPLDPFLRQGCILVPDTERPAVWTVVGRDGSRSAVEWDTKAAVEYAKAAAKGWGIAEGREVKFDPKRAKADMAGKKK